MSTDKTLADVQPGGRVRLGDRPKDGEVLVEVSGLTGSGKSAIAGEIEILCRALGLEVDWINGDEEKRLTHADWIGALEMYKPKVVIVERNVSRSPDTCHQACEPSLATAARAAIPFVAYAFSEGVDGAEEAGRSIEAALSAQPSPGGQGDARAQFEAWADDNAIDTAKLSDGEYLADDAYHAWLGRQAALAARQPVGHACTNCDRKHAEVICPTCAGTAWDNGRLHEFHETRELCTSLGEGPLDHLLPEEWHEKPLLRFQGAYDEGDDSVGISPRSANVLAEDQNGTVLGDYLAARAAKEGGQ
ncbi:TPA: hypothetical protein ACXN37_000190 [Stenotrophomonas maltophilia]|uniref:hypothetical protein n=1 Tax=Stenotrophomonas maltophilia TaxID=40324 RepID=UPI0013D9C6A9|nr:hypothetical protein [Stenotrophomonas maltophilia]